MHRQNASSHNPVTFIHCTRMLTRRDRDSSQPYKYATIKMKLHDTTKVASRLLLGVTLLFFNNQHQPCKMCLWLPKPNRKTRVFGWIVYGSDMQFSSQVSQKERRQTSPFFPLAFKRGEEKVIPHLCHWDLRRKQAEITSTKESLSSQNQSQTMANTHKEWREKRLFGFCVSFSVQLLGRYKKRRKWDTWSGCNSLIVDINPHYITHSICAICPPSLGGFAGKCSKCWQIIHAASKLSQP